jgi:hypothetical protein
MTRILFFTKIFGKKLFPVDGNNVKRDDSKEEEICCERLLAETKWLNDETNRRRKRELCAG